MRSTLCGYIFRTEGVPAIKSLSLTDIDLSCATPVQMLDLHKSTEGDAKTRLLPYTREADLALIRAAFSQTSFLRGLPETNYSALRVGPSRFVHLGHPLRCSGPFLALPCRSPLILRRVHPESCRSRDGPR